MVNILIGLLLLLAVIYLSQKGVIKSFKFPIIKWRNFENHGKRKLIVSYSRFNGIEKLPFMAVTIIGNYTRGKCRIFHAKAPVEAVVMRER